MGKVEALWKCGNKEDCSNYIPITLFSILSKKTESVIFDNIDSHLRQVLERNQWGYRKGASTAFGPKESHILGVIFIDFRKTFDSVDHSFISSQTASPWFQWPGAGMGSKLPRKPHTVY